MSSKIKIITDFTCNEAEEIFLKEESYYHQLLPPYFTFSSPITKISKMLKDKKNGYAYYDKKKLIACTGVNYVMLNNKDGHYAWRPLQLIHPCLYANLVHTITEENNWKHIVDRFTKFRSNKKILCQSLDLEKNKKKQILHWWGEVEQKSIELALKYQHVAHTDVVDCYGSIYTHSIAWALHGKEEAKNNKGNTAWIGNKIDSIIQQMLQGQTNGIPQGSVIMDFVAEIVLGYADLQLSEKISDLGNLNDFEIIRSRDDYRIFSNTEKDCKRIVKTLSEILSGFGLRLNINKTNTSDQIIKNSIKPDKFYWLLQKQKDNNLQKHLLIIYQLSVLYPNSGSLEKSLQDYCKRLQNTKNINCKSSVLISIIVDIAFKSPRTYPISAAIIRKLIDFIDDKEDVLNKIFKRFDEIPYTEYLEIWLQRLTLTPSLKEVLHNKRAYKSEICKLVDKKKACIWNSEWVLDKDIKNEVDKQDIIDWQKVENLPDQIKLNEISFFSDY